MEREGYLEFSLGCLTHVVHGTRSREGLEFPLVLQVIDSKDCRTRVSVRNGRTERDGLRKIISVSDGFYKIDECFLLTGNQHLEPYTVIKVLNVDFGYKIERQKDKPKIAGMILDFDIIAKGSDVGYHSGNPSLIRNVETHSRWGRGDNIVHSMDSLSSKLWKQVKEGRCCDVTFSFPHCVVSDFPSVPTVKAQKNALIANSPVFEAQFEGGFSDASSEEVPIMDTEPKYMRCLLQFIFTRFVPLLNLRQAFELLYLARKYIINDLETYCKNFIMRNEKRLAGVTDVFQYLEMNGKSCDDEISQFVWSKFRSCANVLIRQPRFLEIDFDTLETFLTESDLNCHEWELAQAIRRWIVANDAVVKCEEVDTETCAHQLVECIRWAAMPIKECVMVQQWQELKLFHDRSFLTDVMELQRARDGRSISHIEVVPSCINKEYSLNRLHHDDTSFVIYTTLTVDPLSLSVTCMHGQSAAQSTYKQTKCSTIGPPFELLSFYVVPSYGLSNMSNNRVRLTVNLSCQGKSFNADSGIMWVRSQVKLTVFSFSPDFPSKEPEEPKEFNFWPDRDSSNSDSVVFSNNELSHYLYTQDGAQKLDLQLLFNTDMSERREDGRASPPKIMKPLRTSAPRHQPMRPRTTYDNRIDYYREREASGLGRTVSYLRAGARRGEPACMRDGWGDVNRSPQSQEWRGGRWSPERPGDNTIEIRSPEYEQSDGYGVITRSPQSPGSFAGMPEDGVDGLEDQVWERRASSPMSVMSGPSSRSHARSNDLHWAPYRSPGRSPSGRSISPQPGPSHRYRSSGRSPSPQSRGIPLESPRSPSPRPGPSYSQQRGDVSQRRYALRHPDYIWSSTSSHDVIKAGDCPSPPSSPTPPPFSPHRVSPRYSPQPGPSFFSPSYGQPFSPPASPPRQRHSPVVLVKAFASPEYCPPSPSYSPVRSPSVIDIDLEENEDEEIDLLEKENFGEVNMNNQAVEEAREVLIGNNDENQADNVLGESDDNMEGSDEVNRVSTEDDENLAPNKVVEGLDGSDNE